MLQDGLDGLASELRLSKGRQRPLLLVGPGTHVLRTWVSTKRLLTDSLLLPTPFLLGASTPVVGDGLDGLDALLLCKGR